MSCVQWSSRSFNSGQSFRRGLVRKDVGMACTRRLVLIYGGTGSLGSACTQLFSENAWEVVSVSHHNNSLAKVNITIPKGLTLTEEGDYVMQKLCENFENASISSILCVAGGWASGSIGSKAFLKSSQQMIDQNLNPILICSSLAPKFLTSNGFMCLTSSKLSLKPWINCPTYCLTKMATNSMVKMLSMPKSGFPETAHVISLLPGVIDTPENRSLMKGSETSAWHSLEDIARILYNWSCDKESCPTSGSIVSLITEQGKTEYFVHPPEQ